AGWREAAALPALRTAAARSSAEGDVFRDPFLDAPGPAEVRAMLLGVLLDPAAVDGRRAATEALPGADVVSADEELVVRPEDPAAASCAAAVLALRLDFAALYLGLGSGALGGGGRVGHTAG
ncbi:MAG: hypothetical protein M3R63_16305, partial [Actinomycetota bacterium]|nr:hypothetical protein [Actinomycetota bacterium]